jgi:hypothetical protein
MFCRGVPLGLRGEDEGFGRGRGGRLLLCLKGVVSKLQDVEGTGIYLFEADQKRNRQHH